jgi:hypothetical protein
LPTNTPIHVPIAPTSPPSPTSSAGTAGVKSLGASPWLARAAVSWSRAAARRTESATRRAAAATELSRERRYDLD